MDPTITKSPFEIPELKARISRFVSVKDAIACAQVCKSWSDDFTYPIWHTIDFKVQKQFLQVDQRIISKYGHHIHVVKNLESGSEIEKLQNPGICKLERLTIIVRNDRFLIHGYDILRRNNTSLIGLELAKGVPPIGAAIPEVFFSVDCLSPNYAKSRLSSLNLKGLTMTRNAFTFMLRSCPALKSLAISDTVLRSGIVHDVYQHANVTILVASIKRVFQVDPEKPAMPSLLTHFPSLDRWEITNAGSTLDVPIKQLQRDVARYCPRLKRVLLNMTAAISVDMLALGFTKLLEVYVLHKQLSLAVIMAMLRHRKTLQVVKTWKPAVDVYESQTVSAVVVEGHPLQGHGWVVQSLLESCSHLKRIELPEHEMNMDELDLAQWSCTDLEMLCIRVRGLDTKEKIDRTLQIWVNGRRAARIRKVKQDAEKSSMDGINTEVNPSIEERVANHLLKFDKLTSVWLGTAIRRM